MKKLFLLTLACAVLGAPAASAKTYQLPDEKPVVAVTFPGAWKADTYDDGVEATSKDKEIYMAVETADSDDLASSVKQTMKFLKKRGVTVDDATKKESEGKHYGMQAYAVRWSGQDEDGPCIITLTLMQATDKTGLLVIYWASPEGEKKNEREIDSVFASIKPVS